MNYSEEQIANNFYQRAFALAPNPKKLLVNPDELKTYYVVWDGETVEELATRRKISEHNREQKINKFDYFEKEFISGRVKETQILVAKDIDYSELLIIDGIHRSVGFYQAYLKDPDVLSKTNLSFLLFESNKIRLMDDYDKLLTINRN